MIHRPIATLHFRVHIGIKEKTLKKFNIFYGDLKIHFSERLAIIVSNDIGGDEDVPIDQNLATRRKLPKKNGHKIVHF